jgi:hypothetical protein
MSSLALIAKFLNGGIDETRSNHSRRPSRPRRRHPGERSADRELETMRAVLARLIAIETEGC